MAKVPFTKLKCKINEEVKQVQLNDEITIEVKQYLPIQEKLALIGRVIEFAHMQDENYSNPVKAAVFRDLEIVKYYTNIIFTDKQKEDPAKLYDLLYSTNIIKMILNNIPEDEYTRIVVGVKDSIEAIYKYQNSVLGILDTIKEDYSNASFDINALQQLFKDTKDFDLLNNILTNDY